MIYSVNIGNEYCKHRLLLLSSYVKQDTIIFFILSMKNPVIYIMTNKCNRTLYTSVTSKIMRRVYEHKSKLADSFTSKYNCTISVYYERPDDRYAEINRKKQLKSGSRKKKISLIEKLNPIWQDLYVCIC